MTILKAARKPRIRKRKRSHGNGNRNGNGVRNQTVCLLYCHCYYFFSNRSLGTFFHRFRIPFPWFRFRDSVSISGFRIPDSGFRVLVLPLGDMCTIYKEHSEKYMYLLVWESWDFLLGVMKRIYWHGNHSWYRQLYTPVWLTQQLHSTVQLWLIDYKSILNCEYISILQVAHKRVVKTLNDQAIPASWLLT